MSKQLQHSGINPPGGKFRIVKEHREVSLDGTSGKGF